MTHATLKQVAHAKKHLNKVYREGHAIAVKDARLEKMYKKLGNKEIVAIAHLDLAQKAAGKEGVSKKVRAGANKRIKKYSAEAKRIKKHMVKVGNKNIATRARVDHYTKELNKAAEHYRVLAASRAHIVPKKRKRGDGPEGH
jgi:hypothetical protein